MARVKRPPLTQPLDYEKVGLKAGLEVHQQLMTPRKLFCQCPAGRYTGTHDGAVLRHMRPTLSEVGEYDGTALMEFKTKKNIIYLLHKDNTCTYEMDDTPPFLVNQNAMDVAIEQCLMLGCDIIDEVHIARKQYLDGSIPTGFQRTAIVGVNGRIPFRGRDLTVTQVSIEEDSCREVRDRGHLVVWRTDRLGMPLIETVTAPELRTPDEVEEAILLIGRVCRSTRHVRTGPGASRQDVNVSVRGGRRVEIKGVPSARLAPALVHGEAWRQVNLLQLRDELKKRGEPKIESADVTEFFSARGPSVLRAAAWETFVRENEYRAGFETGAGPFTVRAVVLKGLRGTLDWPTQPGRTFAHELEGRIRVICGLDQPPILIHTEAWPGSDIDLSDLRKLVRAGENDSVILVWGPEQDTRQAAEEVRLRYVDGLDGVPNETRQYRPDGSTDFERILPGPDRMYPDTDSPPTKITVERVDERRKELPETPWAREERYSKAGVSTATIHYLIRRGGADLVDRVVANGADLRRACFFFGEQLKGFGRRRSLPDGIPVERWDELFAHPLLLEAWADALRRIAQRPDQPLPAPNTPAQWAVDAREYSPRRQDSPEVRARHAMGRTLRKLRGRVPVAEVCRVIEEKFGCPMN